MKNFEVDGESFRPPVSHENPACNNICAYFHQEYPIFGSEYGQCDNLIIDQEAKLKL